VVGDPVTAKLAAAAAVTFGMAVGLAVLATPAWLLLAYGRAALPTALGATLWFAFTALLLGRGGRRA
jgi:uncharacterized membrane protein YhdT